MTCLLQYLKVLVYTGIRLKFRNVVARIILVSMRSATDDDDITAALIVDTMANQHANHFKIKSFESDEREYIAPRQNTGAAALLLNGHGVVNAPEQPIAATIWSN